MTEGVAFSVVEKALGYAIDLLITKNHQNFILVIFYKLQINKISVFYSVMKLSISLVLPIYTAKATNTGWSMVSTCCILGKLTTST